MLRRLATSAALRIAVALVAVGLGVAAVARRGDQVRAALGALSAPALLLALVAVLAGLFAGMLSWRALLADLGSPLPIRAAARVFFLGQLGKYLPGSVWAVVGQVELGRDVGVPRRRSAAVAVLTLGLSLAAGLAVAAATLPLTSRTAAARYWPALAAVPLVLAAVHPAVLNRGVGRLLALARRPPLERPLSPRGVGTAFGWAVLAWVALGLHVAALGADLGGSRVRLLPLAVGGFALAWSVGFLVLVVPAGLGVREAALVAALAPALHPAAALVVAVVSRVLMTGGDLLCAGAVTAAGAGSRAAGAPPARPRDRRVAAPGRRPPAA